MEEKGFASDKPGRTKPLSPEDIKLFGETAGYKVYYSKETQGVIIETIDYHPGELYLFKSDLERLLRNIAE